MINVLQAHLAEHGPIAHKGIGDVQELGRIIEAAKTDVGAGRSNDGFSTALTEVIEPRVH
jgi:hypothetical protein